jgi:hypothetical protein
MIQMILSELMTMHSKTTEIELFAIAFYYNIYIAICLENNSYMTFGKEENPLCIIYKIGNAYKLEREPNNSILSNKFKHYNYLRPLSAISNYKTEELYQIYHNLGLHICTIKTPLSNVSVTSEQGNADSTIKMRNCVKELPDRIKKNDLYQLIVEHLYHKID